MKLYFITHPMVNINPNTPVNKWSISEEGWRQGESLSKESFWKDVDIIFASTEQKANKTAKFWSEKFNIPLKIVGGIQEIDRSSTGFLTQDKFWRIVDEFYAKPAERVHGWESAEECLNRMVKTVNSIIKENLNKNLAIVSHGAVGNLYACNIKDIKATHQTGQTKIGSWFVLDLDSNKIISDWKEY